MSATLQLVPRSALPKMPVAGPRAMDRGSPIRTSRRPVFPRRLHRAGRDRRDRLPEQGGGLRHPLPGHRRNPENHRGRSQAPRRRDRLLRRAAQLGTEPSVHHPHLHCVVPGGGLSPDGQRWISCRPGFLSCRSACCPALFRRLFLESLQRAFDAGKAAVLRLPGAASRTACTSPSYLARSERPRVGGLRQALRSPDPSRCSTTWAATPIAWPSPTIACSTSKTIRSSFRGRTIATAARSKR